MDINKFIFIGDSLTFGYGVSKTKCWLELFKNYNLSSHLNFSIVNKGINGNTTTDMLNRFTEDVTIYNPKSIFIMGGTNDLLSNRSLNLILANIELMIKEALTKTNNVIVGTPPIIIKKDAYNLFMPSLTYDSCENNLPMLREKLISLCNNYKIKYVNFYNLTLKINSKEIFIDGIHFNEKGHDFLFKEFINKLSL